MFAFLQIKTKNLHFKEKDEKMKTLSFCNGFKGVSAFLSIFLVFASFAFADNERERERERE